MKIEALKNKARQLKQNVNILYLALKHPETPWYAKALIAIIVSYAVSPIDLIPDFIPVLGYLDDLILLPAGITLAIRLIPREVIEQCRMRSLEEQERPKGIYFAIFIVLLWLLAAYYILRLSGLWNKLLSANS